ncbi:FAD:protein FMN transferase [Ruegeria sp. HKCCD8929]|uniref:FAD:protein FMN transferase n=1 Tax=Ruegeria sp. HKCCD8929 TaxID=2683006 RepID=UPI001487619F|nr:FAD:protein FMN transferase [Ruegeria sp. HKCCD8929]
MTHLSRRRFLTISAACAALPSGALAARVAHWRGTALGAGASLRLEGLTDVQAAPVIASVEAELERLERVFSLYRPDSQLSRLNRDGRLSNPAPELLDVLSLSTALHDATGGVFDPSIQPLWVALAQGASGDDLDGARKVVGWGQVHIRRDEIRLDQPGRTALTLNGIAQGAITDRIAALLRGHGLTDVLVDMGEIAALGTRADGGAWRVGLAGPDGAVAQRITLRDRAVATSSPMGTVLGEGQGHILDPTGKDPLQKTVAISAPSAALADGLSTALCLMPRDRGAQVLTGFPGTKLELLI